MNFHELHSQETPLLIGNVWDVPSARSYEKLNFAALGTSSAAIAAMLGYEDGESMPFAELLNIVRRIKANTSLPFSVDIEAGYGESVEAVCENISSLINLDIAGINIEDSLVSDARHLVAAEAFSERLSAISAYLKSNNSSLFLNVRTDPFLLQIPNAREEAIRRGRMYQDAGADGLFVPCIVKQADIKAVVDAISLPINVMCMPDLPDFQTLKQLGVRRISMGNFPQVALQQYFDSLISSIQNQQSFSALV